MAYTLDQYNALTAAIAEGVAEVQYEDRRVRYRNQDAMLALQRIMARELGLEPTGPRRKRMASSKGIWPVTLATFDNSLPWHVR